VVFAEVVFPALQLSDDRFIVAASNDHFNAQEHTVRPARTVPSSSLEISTAAATLQPAYGRVPFPSTQIEFLGQF
jgi:hypothetical protein